MIKHMNIKICGQVQGVFFRHHAQEKAKNLNLTGLVRNEPDGTVYVEAEGEKDNLKDFLAWCQQGPKWAEVSKVEHQFSSQIENYNGFKIQY